MKKKYIRCFTRTTPATNNIYKLISFWINICCFFLKLLFDQEFVTVIHSNFLSAMHGFRDNEVYCQPDMTSTSVLRQGALQAIFRDEFWKSEHDFLIVFHIIFWTGMHGFRDNEILLPTGYDVIVISPLEVVSHRFCWRNLKEWPQFLNHNSLKCFAYLFPFRSYSTFYFGW